MADAAWSNLESSVAGDDDDLNEDAAFGLTAPFTVEKLGWAMVMMANAHRLHIRLCSRDRKSTEARLKRIELLVWMVMVGAMTTLLGIIGYLLTHPYKTPFG